MKHFVPWHNCRPFLSTLSSFVCFYFICGSNETVEIDLSVSAGVLGEGDISAGLRHISVTCMGTPSWHWVTQLALNRGRVHGDIVCWSWLPACLLIFDWTFHEKATIIFSLNEGRTLLLELFYVWAIVAQIAGGTTALPVLQAVRGHRAVICIICRTKSVYRFVNLPFATCLSLNGDYVVHIMNITCIVALLRYFCEVAALAIAHCYLPVLAFHVCVVGLNLEHCLAIYPFEHILEAVIAWVDVV